MTAKDRFQHARGLFSHAIELPPDQRATYLAEACGDDDALRHEVERLLAFDRESRIAIDAAADGRIAEDLVATLAAGAGAADDAMPERIGNYRILRIIGHGGMGTVFEAEQENPKRRVALKVVRAGYLSPHLIRRFEHEAFVLGQLQHPGIAHIYESGMAEVAGRQQPYFAMEYIAGERITDFADKRNLDIRQRLALMARVCDAVQHAHQKGVIHRDLKPANILVVDGDSTTLRGLERGDRTRNTNTGSLTLDQLGRPKILDFGIARMTDSDVQSATLQTDVGQLVGTLAYMSPEQVAGDSSKLDTRCDVYALGVVLFQLLTGRLPVDIAGQSIAEAARLIRDAEPSSAGTLVRSLRGDVDTMIAKALEKDPDRRYESAAQFAADIRRHLADEPIVARPASPMYQALKFARRNRGLVAGLATAFVVLLLGVTGTSIGLVSALRVNRELDKTNANLQELSSFQSAQLSGIDVSKMGLQLRDEMLGAVPDEQRSTLETQLAGVNFVDVARNTLEANFFRRAIDAIEAQFAGQPLLQASMLQELATTMRALGLLNAALAPQEHAVEIRRRELGNESPDTLDSINLLGVLNRDLGNLKPAEALYHEAIATMQRVFGDDDARTMDVRGNLAQILRLKGDLDDAEALSRQALEGLRAKRGPGDADTLDVETNLAAVLATKGKNEEAEMLYREVLDTRRRTLGPEDAETLSAAFNLSTFMESVGKYDESTSLSRETLETRRRVLGENHPATLASMTQYAIRLGREGKFEDAEKLLREALDKRRRLFGTDNQSTLSTLDGLASLLDDNGHFDEAEQLFRESLAATRRMFGDDNPDTLRAMSNVGYTLNEQGKFEEAEPFYRETLAGLRRAHGNDNPWTLTAVGNLAALLLNLGKYDEAEPLYHESLEGRRRLLGDDHPSTLNAIYNMGNMLMQTGKLDEAEPFCRQALEGYRRVGGDDHIGTLYSLTNLGRLLILQKKPAEAEPYYREAVERRRRINGDDHSQTAIAVAGLADALEAQDRWSDAEEWRRFLLDAANRAEPASDEVRAERLAELGENLLCQKKYKNAETVLVECTSIYEKTNAADDWPYWAAQSLLGAAIAADPDRYRQAERLLIDSYTALDAQRDKFPSDVNILRNVRSRLVKLYEAWGKPDEAARWK